MLQFDIRVTVRDPKTREALDDYTESDKTIIEWVLEDKVDEWIHKVNNREILLTVASLKVVK